MQSSYNEEELLLRILLGLVFPFLLLVSLRMTRLGLRSWEKRWRLSATRWLSAFAARRGASNPESLSRGAVAAALAAARIAIYFSLILCIALVWFVLFPQTRPLASELARGLAAPVLALVGKALGGILLIGYSAGLLACAFWATRLVSGRTKFRLFKGAAEARVFAFPLKVGIWALAFFLFFMPYPGMPRLAALGILLIAFLTAVIALRPVIEEIAIGIHLRTSLGLEPGKALKVGGRLCRVRELRSCRLVAERDDELVSFPYSLLLKSETADAE